MPAAWRRTKLVGEESRPSTTDEPVLPVAPITPTVIGPSILKSLIGWKYRAEGTLKGKCDTARLLGDLEIPNRASETHPGIDECGWLRMSHNEQTACNS